MKRILWLLFCGLAMHLTAADAVWQTPFRKTDELKSWTRYDALQVNNDGLVLTNPEGKDGMRGIFRDFPAEAFRGPPSPSHGRMAGRRDPKDGSANRRSADSFCADLREKDPLSRGAGETGDISMGIL